MLYAYQADALRGSLARKVGRDAAEDIVARAFVRLAERLEIEFVKDGPALLGSIVTGMVKNHYRDKARRPEIAVGLAGELDQIAERQHILTQDEHDFGVRFDQAVRGLDPDDRDAYILTELRGLPVREAADVLDTSKDTVHRRAEAARTTIQKELVT